MDIAKKTPSNKKMFGSLITFHMWASNLARDVASQCSESSSSDRIKEKQMKPKTLIEQGIYISCADGSPCQVAFLLNSTSPSPLETEEGENLHSKP